MVTAEDALYLYQTLTAHGIQLWLTGGWGIDALLGEQTRPHKDMDILLRLEDIPRMCALLEADGFQLHELWSENRWVTDAQEKETATAFVLQDDSGRQVDAHALCLDQQGNGIPAWEDDEGRVFKPQDLAGEGMIAGISVPCISAEMQFACHTGYTLPDYQQHDLERLRRHRAQAAGKPE